MSERRGAALAVTLRYPELAAGSFSAEEKYFLTVSGLTPQLGCVGQRQTRITAHGREDVQRAITGSLATLR